MDLKLYVDSDFEGVDKDGLRQLCKAAKVKVAPTRWLRLAAAEEMVGPSPEARAARKPKSRASTSAWSARLLVRDDQRRS